MGRLAKPNHFFPMSSPIDKYFTMTPPVVSIQELSSVSHAEPERKKDSGRWTIQESQIYVEALKKCTNSKDVMTILKAALPNRMESQIRAHHQKMIKKYGSIPRIVEIYDKCENKKFVRLSRKLREALAIIKRYKMPNIVSEGRHVLEVTPKAPKATPQKETEIKVKPYSQVQLSPYETPVKLQQKE